MKCEVNRTGTHARTPHKRQTELGKNKLGKSTNTVSICRHPFRRIDSVWFGLHCRGYFRSIANGQSGGLSHQLAGVSVSARKNCFTKITHTYMFVSPLCNRPLPPPPPPAHIFLLSLALNGHRDQCSMPGIFVVLFARVFVYAHAP